MNLPTPFGRPLWLERILIYGEAVELVAYVTKHNNDRSTRLDMEADWDVSNRCRKRTLPREERLNVKAGQFHQAYRYCYIVFSVDYGGL